MNTEKGRAEVWKAADGQFFYRVANRVEAHDGPLLKKRRGQILRGTGNAVKQQKEPLAEDSDINNLSEIASNVL